MTDPGLSNRLRQHSRRAGAIIGLSMAATIAICVGGFALTYGALTPLFAGIVPIEPAATQPAPMAQNPVGDGVALVAETPSGPAVDAPVETPPPPTPTAEPAVEPTPTAEAFAPTHQISATQSVNFRSGGSRNDPPIQTLPPSTPLQFLDERQETDNPEDEPGWMKFRIESGEEGWVREIDTDPYVP